MALGWVLAACLCAHCSVWARGGPALSLLLADLNAIMPVGSGGAWLAGTFSPAHTAVGVLFEGEIHLNLMSPTCLTFSYFLLCWAHFHLHHIHFYSVIIFFAEGLLTPRRRGGVHAWVGICSIFVGRKAAAVWVLTPKKRLSNWPGSVGVNSGTCWVFLSQYQKPQWLHFFFFFVC